MIHFAKRMRKMFSSTERQRGAHARQWGAHVRQEGRMCAHVCASGAHMRAGGAHMRASGAHMAHPVHHMAHLGANGARPCVAHLWLTQKCYTCCHFGVAQLGEPRLTRFAGKFPFQMEWGVVGI